MKRKTRTMDAVLATMAVFLLVFVVVMLWLYQATGGIPDTLCTCVFAVCGGECGVMGWIRTTKDRQRERRYELEDRRDGQGCPSLQIPVETGGEKGDVDEG